MNAPQPAATPRLDLTDQELFYRLGWFINLRWLAGLGCTGVIFLSRYVLRIPLPMHKLVGGILFILVCNAFCALVAKVMYVSQRVSRRNIIVFANGQIALDLVALTLLIHFGGGVENLFLIFYIFHMVIASELLSPANALVHATFAALLINGVAWLEAFDVIPHVHLGRAAPPELYRNRFFVFEICFILTVTLYITVYLATSISARLRERERELEDANVELRSLDEQKSFFMRKVSHELRSPLAAIQTLLKVILTGHRGQLAPQQQEMVQRADNRAGELLALVDELLLYSRLRHATRLERREPVALSDLARKVVDLFTPMGEDRGIDLRAELGRAVVEGDEEGLEELITNLVSNAVRYTHRGGSILVRTGVEGGRVQLEVSDTGIGIEPDHLPHIFEEFHRAPSAKHFAANGTGLGMAIAKRVTDMHHGHIDVQSAPNEGTTFTVTLPLAGLNA